MAALRGNLKYAAKLVETPVNGLSDRSSILLTSTIGRISEPYIVWGTVFVQTKRHSLP